MKNWDLRRLDVPPHGPEILSTTDDARAILINLPAGEQLQEHEVHERAFLVVAGGEVEVTAVGGESLAAAAGHLFEFDPQERHEITARSDARLLLLLTPWPGEGHPGAMSMEQKSEARERAAEHPPR